MQGKDAVEQLLPTKPADNYKLTPRWWELGLSIVAIFLLPLSLTLYLN